MLGIDVGTSGLKALLLASSGDLLGTCMEFYPLCVPRPGWAEQDPNMWWSACVKAVKRLLAVSGIKPKAIAGVGLTGQMHGSVFLGAKGQVLSPALLWCDQRTVREAAEITRAAGGEKSLLEHTCNLAQTGFTAPKVLWVRRHLPQVFRATRKVLMPKDYVRYALTASLAADVSDASGTLLFDVHRRRWSAHMLKALKLDAELFPDALESCEVAGKISRAASRATGLLEGTPVVAGAGDQAAGAIGCGVIAPGVVSCTLGTSGVVFAACGRPKATPDGKLHLFCSAVKGGWHLMGVMLSAGGALRWLRDEVVGKSLVAGAMKGTDPYDLIVKAAEKVPAGSEGLIFLPYLTGERTPHADPFARGVFFGLSLKHSSAHLARCVMEGVAYGMKDSMELVKGMGVGIKGVRFSGGGARSPLWCRIQAAVYGAAGRRLKREEGPAMGAAILAGLGARVFSSLPGAVRTCVAERDEFRPCPRMKNVYRDGYRVYRRLYPALRGLFRDSARIASES